MVAIRQVLVRAEPKALVSRSCHLTSAILRLYISVAIIEGESCHLMINPGCDWPFWHLHMSSMGFDNATK
jgi:hypothetical protein